MEPLALGLISMLCLHSDITESEKMRFHLCLFVTLPEVYALEAFIVQVQVVLLFTSDLRVQFHSNWPEQAFYFE